ncbi:uncharacterized protein J3D65DRAFT_630350 [Phyllosticta citribraziliensis]|uniref:Uncharacterized protein n=1 Tax=Phyllosticta citribraziliensis TaxID=989973 RepID=A0ABR1LIZ1_9PEZI
MCLRKPLRACIPPSPSFLSFPLRQPARRARGLIESNQRQRRCFDSLAPSIPHICLTPTALAQKNKVAHLTSPFSHCCTEGAGMSTCHPEQVPTAPHREREQASSWRHSSLLQPTNAKTDQTRSSPERSTSATCSVNQSIPIFLQQLPLLNQIRGREIRGTHRRPFPKRGAQGCETRRRASQPCAMYVRYSMMKGKGGGPINQGISQQHRVSGWRECVRRPPPCPPPPPPPPPVQSSPVQSDSGRRTAENTARQEGRGHR